MMSRLFLAVALLSFVGAAQPCLGQYYETLVGKECGNCGKPVSLSARVGDRCPHCGAVWGVEQKRYIGGVGVVSPPAVSLPIATPHTSFRFSLPSPTQQAWPPAVAATPSSAGWIGPGARVRTIYNHTPVQVGYQVLTTLDAGRELVVLRTQGPWAGVTVYSYGRALRGWVHQQHLALVSPAP